MLWEWSGVLGARTRTQELILDAAGRWMRFF